MASKKSRVPNRQKTVPKKAKNAFVFTPRAKWTLILSLAAILLIILFFTIRYHAQALRVDSEGHVITNGENWLVYDVGTSSNHRYLKFGEVAPAEGYALDKTDSIYDENEKIYYFTPTDDANPVTNYAVMIGNGTYESLAETTSKSVVSMNEGSEGGDVQKKRIGNTDTSYYIYTGPMKNAETGDITHYSKQMNAYIQARGEQSVVIMINQQRPTNEGFMEDALFEAELEKVLENLTVDR